MEELEPNINLCAKFQISYINRKAINLIMSSNFSSTVIYRTVLNISSFISCVSTCCESRESNQHVCAGEAQVFVLLQEPRD